MVIKNVIKDYKNKENPSKIEWIILFLIIIILFYSYMYWDMVITTRHGINVWYSLTSGDIRDFYMNNLKPPISRFASSSASYPFSVYIVFAIWDFPLWVMEAFFHKDPFLSTWALLYGKTILLPFLIGSAYVLSKICKELSFSKNYTKWFIFYFMSSCLVFYAMLLLCQYDILSLLFTLIGLYYYINGNFKKFLLFFAIAISFKFFALLIFIPLILLYEKRILRIIFYTICSYGICILYSLFFNMPKEVGSHMINLLRFTFVMNLPFLGLNVPMFITINVIFWIFCYMKKPKGNLTNLTLYISFVSFAIFFTLSKTYGYWIILIVPYLCIFCFSNKEYRKLAMIIETVLSSVFVFNEIGISKFFTLGRFASNAALPNIFGKIKENSFGMSFSDFLSEKLNNETLFSFIPPTCFAIFVGCIFMFGYINYYMIKPSNMNNNDDEEIIYRSVILIRLLINTIICSLLIFLFFYTK